MAATKYTYSIQDDFPNHAVASDRLLGEIRASAIVTAVDYINTDSDDCDIWFKAALSSGDEDTLDDLVAAHSGTPLPNPTYESDGTPIVSLYAKQSGGVPMVTSVPRIGSEWIFGTHNLADKCSWFGDSVRVTDETLSAADLGYTYVSDHENWVDMLSGRVHNDDVWVLLQQMLNPGDPHGYGVVVTVNGATKTMREPFESSGGDYEVLWDDGKIVFFSSQLGKTVTASYNYATTSTFYLRPFPGKVLSVETAEADISLDAIMADGVVYGVWTDGEGGKVCTGSYVYKRAGQIPTEAKGNYPKLTAMGATTSELLISDIREFRRKSRGVKSDRHALPFQYSTARHLYSSKGDELRVFTAHNRALGGEHVTMTFYCTEEDE